MDPQEKFELLVKELERFIADQAVALRDNNWSYMRELLQKKENHLRAMVLLLEQVDVKDPVLGDCFDRFQRKESAVEGQIQNRMNAQKAEIESLECTYRHLKKMRDNLKMQTNGDPAGKFKAEV